MIDYRSICVTAGIGQTNIRNLRPSEIYAVLKKGLELGCVISDVVSKYLMGDKIFFKLL